MSFKPVGMTVEETKPYMTNTRLIRLIKKTEATYLITKYSDQGIDKELIDKLTAKGSKRSFRLIGVWSAKCYSDNIYPWVWEMRDMGIVEINRD